jgi:hypothetical protein
MAFEPLMKFATNIKKEVLRQREVHNELSSKYLVKDMDPSQLNRYRRALYSDDIYCLVMTDYYESIHAIKKFTSQSAQIKQMIIELWPAYAKGYFNLKS